MPLTKAYLALGSNLGERFEQLRDALRFLEEEGAGLLVQTSPVYENRAVGMGEGAGLFLNAVAEVRTPLPAEELLQACLRVEDRLGRTRSGGWAPRTIDIDILAYGDSELQTGRLELPHPRIEERDFVVRPLLDIAPELRVRGRAVRELAKALEMSGVRRLEARLSANPGVNCIVACAANRVIGRKGVLPWSAPEDWDIFLKKTLGGTLVMGRASFFEMTREPTWAQDRRFVVLTHQRERVESMGAAVVDSVAAGVAAARETGRPVWICGGEAVYREALPLTERLHLTQIDACVAGDTYFPEWHAVFTKTVASVPSTDENYKYTFHLLER
ncbi:MAG: 2-amino-4-hydroxy-6-hydroxymethyldihydropteridine diphosphokinase [Opitutales bacterium]